MKILGVGGGGREHAIADKLSMSEHSPQIYWISEYTNPGINAICRNTKGEYIRGNTTDPRKVVEFAKKVKPDFVFVGPEEPNFHGVADALEKEGIQCIGAKKAVAVIEMSKAEMRRLQWKYDIKGKLLFKTFRSSEEAHSTLDKYSKTLTWLQNVALKPARQAGGKGVKVIEDRQIYLHDEKQKFKSRHFDWLEGYMKPYADVEDKILVEENVWGPEYTLHCFTDGKNVVGMPMVQDNKNAHEFDIGTETGGMGSISGPGNVLPFLTEDEYKESLEIVKSMVMAIQDMTGETYHGIVAGQMMLTEIEGPTVIEMYSRLGDPEALNVMAMLESDLVDIALAILDGKLKNSDVKFNNKAVVVKALSPKGYPDYRELAKNHPIEADEKAIQKKGAKLYWASVDNDGKKTITMGSRAVEIAAVADDLPTASRIVESCIDYVKLTDGWQMYHRSDIGTKELLAKRQDLAERARSLYLQRKQNGTLGKRTDWLPGVGRVDPVQNLKKELLSG